MLTTRTVGKRRVYTLTVGRVRLSARRATWQWDRVTVSRDSRSWLRFAGAIYLPFVVVTVLTTGGQDDA